MQRPLALFSGLILLGCNTVSVTGSKNKQSRAIRPESEVFAQARKANFKYIETLRQAETGDIAAAVRLVNFSQKTDAAGALAHGWVLLEVKRRIGEREFSAALQRASPNGRAAAVRLMEVASKYDQH
jgi:hypothetical protein